MEKSRSPSSFGLSLDLKFPSETPERVQQNSFSGSNSKVLKKGGQSRETKPGAAKWAAAGPSVHAGGHGRLFGLRSFQPWPQAVLQRKQASWRKLCTLHKAKKTERPQEKPRTQGHWASVRTKKEEGISRMAGPSAATQGRARPRRPSVCPTPSLWAARLGASRSASTGVRHTAQAGVPRGRGQPHGTWLSVPEDKAPHLPHGT